MTQLLLMLIFAVCGAVLVLLPFLRANAAVRTEPATKSLEPGARHERDRDDAGLEGLVPSASTSVSRRINRLTAAGVAGVVLIGASALYIATEPAAEPAQLPAMTTASSASTSQVKLPDVDTMIGRVADRLKKDPANAEDWRMLGWSYFETQRYSEAVDAYAHAVALQPGSAAYQSAYGEAQTLAAGGKVTPEALKALNIALKDMPSDERTLHFVGLSKSQNGDAKGAVEDWLLALKSAKPDSLWVPRLRAEIIETAKTASIDIGSRLPPASAVSDEKFAGPTAQLAQQAQSMTPEEQQAMIKNMVSGLDERLARNPRDREGWMRLIRSRKVLGEVDMAREALDRALKAFADDPTTQVELKAAALELGLSTGG